MRNNAELGRLRRTLRRQRRGLSPEFRATAAASAAAALARCAPPPPRHLGLYSPSDGEIDPAPLAAALSAGATRTYLPRISPFSRRPQLRFGDPASLAPGRYGIPAPNRGLRPAWTLSWVILPLVAFSDAGDRLGRGGGFYDSSFAAHWPHQPFLLGLAYAFQGCAPWRRAPHDVRLDAVVTEAGVQCFSLRAQRLLEAARG
ncbi:MAG: 5-formyltetrahydrofolate cyclo-ligase [Pseudomonadales bacterium]|jgi:5-formyltetrahydrofolate cyclo-ligase